MKDREPLLGAVRFDDCTVFGLQYGWDADLRPFYEDFLYLDIIVKIERVSLYYASGKGPGI